MSPASPGAQPSSSWTPSVPGSPTLLGGEASVGWGLSTDWAGPEGLGVVFPSACALALPAFPVLSDSRSHQKPPSPPSPCYSWETEAQEGISMHPRWHSQCPIAGPAPPLAVAPRPPSVAPEVLPPGGRRGAWRALSNSPSLGSLGSLGGRKEQGEWEERSGQKPRITAQDKSRRRPGCRERAQGRGRGESGQGRRCGAGNVSEMLER